MTHIMLDMETWGTRPGCAIRSIGAVVFDPKSDQLGAEFYCNVDDHSCDTLGLHRDDDTVRWWNEQSQEAQMALLQNQIDVATAVSKLIDFWFTSKGHVIWSQGSNFDVVLVEHVIRRVGRTEPWKFYNTRDTRTAYEMGGLNPRNIPREGTYHNALDDAKHQARCVQRAWAMIGAAR